MRPTPTTTTTTTSFDADPAGAASALAGVVRAKNEAVALERALSRPPRVRFTLATILRPAVSR